MKRILAVQHSTAEFLGALEPPLEVRGIGFSYVRTVAGDDLHGTPSLYDALVLLGAAHSPADRARCPWLADEHRLIKAFENARRPVIGLGEGALSLAAAHGAKLEGTDLRARIARARGLDAADPVSRALDGREVLVLARGRAELGAGLQPIAADEQGDWIAFRCEPAGYGLLLRPELRPGMLEDMVMEEDRELPDDFGTLIEAVRQAWPGLEDTGRRVAAALVEALGLMDERRKPPVFLLQERR